MSTVIIDGLGFMLKVMKIFSLNFYKNSWRLKFSLNFDLKLLKLIY